MKVALLSTNDVTGGAAMVTLRLTRALREAGVDATMVAARRQAPELTEVAPAGPRPSFLRAFLSERLGIFLRNGLNRADLFKVDTGNRGMPLWRHRAVREADVVVVAWVNQGMLSLRGLERIARRKPVVVVMHDMWWLTGICHHAGDCRGYMAQCGDCPLLGRAAGPRDLSHTVWERKKRIYNAIPGLHFVAVSSWLADKCRESSLLRERQVSVIPNPFEMPEGPLDKPAPQGRVRILFVAARLDDPIKGLPYAIRALNRAEELAPGRFEAVFVGNIRDDAALGGLKMPFTRHDAMPPERLRQFYRTASFVISTSLYETLPTTLVEGQAAGCYPVSFDRGGQCDIITPGQTGALVPFGDTDAFADAIADAAGRIAADTGLPARLRASVEARFSAPAVAERFTALFRQLRASLPK